MRGAEQLAVAKLWLTKAKTDLALAKVILKKGPDLEPWAAGFHAQQAAEKSMKAVLVAEGIEPPRDHTNTRRLAERTPSRTHEVRGCRHGNPVALCRARQPVTAMDEASDLELGRGKRHDKVVTVRWHHLVSVRWRGDKLPRISDTDITYLIGSTIGATRPYVTLSRAYGLGVRFLPSLRSSWLMRWLLTPSSIPASRAE